MHSMSTVGRHRNSAVECFQNNLTIKSQFVIVYWEKNYTAITEVSKLQPLNIAGIILIKYITPWNFPCSAPPPPRRPLPKFPIWHVPFSLYFMPTMTSGAL